ncbi:beta-glucosidase-like glycosyl hydrolase [Sphaerochaeta pleomorpha str. Grapes]|uniref:Beta-glucosidase-like glycosyl hydrolase n=1 Tax=Sphaerochaeta pleomorpha (strain ATCC BAA-1885 / DSM 22778 / Grapes) TaxID=158190 RepID=G8QRC4_SPHPG|nr:glycoside hydrolase family 3 protein [Sphaerochaeta pleomorpha]AEV28777.1 beta-glucosidase-like glycosyl hydrolase [Sphaerochaeta pleomorpha str. Grapes]
MDDAQKIGQHFVCGFPGTSLDESFKEAVHTYKIANIILFARNIESKGQVRQLCQDIQELVQKECGTPALICIDQEGGMVTRLSSDCTNVPGAMALSATGEVNSVFEAGALTGRELRALGINCDLAPCLDVNSNKNNPVIGVRSYGDSEKTVSSFGCAMVEALQSEGVMSVAKHFPGHGDTHLDSHLDLPWVAGDLQALEEHLYPFRLATFAGVQGIMSSHILFPALEKEKVPATMSRSILTDLLKKEMGFKGLVFSDCMEMQAIANYYGTASGSLASLQAGVDLVCISHHVELAIQAIALVKEALATGRLDKSEFTASTDKIIKAKVMLSLEKNVPFSEVGSKEHKATAQKLREKSLTLVRGNILPLGTNPYFVGPRCFLATNVSNERNVPLFASSMAELLGGDYFVCSDNPDSTEIDKIKATGKDATSIIIGTYNAHLRPGQIDLVHAFVKGKIPVTCIALRNPYDLALVGEGVTAIAAYEYTQDCFEALSRLLRKEIEATGSLPVQL